MGQMSKAARRKETARKLNLLADYTVTVPEKRFDMHVFFRDGADTRVLMPPDVDCGTSACSLGWATTIKEFQDAGLHFGYSSVVQYASTFGVDAGRQFFDITDDEAYNLFGCVARTVAQQVVELREVARRYE